ncbi:MAG: DUF4126 domain-containing protein [Syntrophobacteraceae bacterium]
MDQLNPFASMLSLALALGWASGLNLYATMLMLGILGSTGSIVLPPGLLILTHPAVLMAAGFMYVVEFFADKVPGVDSGWDVLHTFIRIPAGSVLAAASLWNVDPAVGLAAAILGGMLSAGSHAAKAGTRALINTSPEPFTNWTASFFEDILVIAGLWAALSHPYLFLVFLFFFLLFIIWLIPRLWKAIGRLFQFFARLFGRGSQPAKS